MPPHPGSQLLHKALATASGAGGGAFGLATLPVELPAATHIIILRSIAEIARSEGDVLSDPELALSCVQVFALGGRAGSDDAAVIGYFAVRGVLAKSVTEAARFVAERGLLEAGAPQSWSASLPKVASRFGLAGDAEGRGADLSGHRRAGRRVCELRIHRAFSGRGPRPFRGSPAGAAHGKDVDGGI